VRADHHESHVSRITIKPGFNNARISLNYNAVTFDWSVVPVTFEDRYEVVVNATFETKVPVPVVVVEPAAINLPRMCGGQVYNGEFKLTNHGLIDAVDVEIPIPESDENFKYELSSTFGGKIKAGQTVVVPFRITCLKPIKGDCP
jgi:hypothetical protein